MMQADTGSPLYTDLMLAANYSRQGSSKQFRRFDRIAVHVAVAVERHRHGPGAFHGVEAEEDAQAGVVVARA
jgi:hypothetical protein